MKAHFLFTIGVIVLIISFTENKNNSMQPKVYPSRGFVPNDTVARKIAETILLPLYGKGILNQEPFDVSLIKDSIWLVEGHPKILEPGGTVTIEIQRKDCKVLKVFHGK